MNNITLIGRLTKNPELNTTGNGTKYSRFSISVSRGKVKEGDPKADFIPCIAWKSTAEILAKYAHKGQLIGVNGKLNVKEYEKDGEKRKAFEVLVLVMELLGGKPTADKPEDEDNGAALPFDV